jgi:hypothetical protein
MEIGRILYDEGVRSPLDTKHDGATRGIDHARTFGGLVRHMLKQEDEKALRERIKHAKKELRDAERLLGSLIARREKKAAKAQ